MYNKNIHNHFFCFRKTGSTVYRTWTTLSEPVETRHQQVRALETGVVLGRKPRYRLRKKTVEEKKRRRRPKRRPKIDADAARRRWARRGAVASTNEWNGHHIFFVAINFSARVALGGSGSFSSIWFRVHRLSMSDSNAVALMRTEFLNLGSLFLRQGVSNSQCHRLRQCH